MTTAPPCTSPAALSLQALADQCVQCGLCLSACPTYALEPIEAESPRGRIALIKAWESSLQAPTEAGERHLDRCLSCRRCESICPANVAYGPMLIQARTRQRSRRPLGWRQRGAELLAARANLRSIAFGLYRQLWPLLPSALKPLPRPHRAATRPIPIAKIVDTSDAAIFIDCIAQHYEEPARVALSTLLDAIGLGGVSRAARLVAVPCMPTATIHRRLCVSKPTTYRPSPTPKWCSPLPAAVMTP